jgi:hypothetical protein
LDYPNISTDKMGEVFLWTNMFTWRANIDTESLVFDTHIRSDELWENDNVYIKNSTIVKLVVHWWWDKILNNSTILSTVIHWNIDINDSTLWSIKHHSVYHNSILNNVEQFWWWVVANWTTIKDSVVWYEILFMPKSELEYCKVWNFSIIWWSYVHNIIVNKNSFIWNALNFDWWNDKASPWMISWTMHNTRKRRDSLLVSSLLSE